MQKGINLLPWKRQRYGHKRIAISFFMLGLLLLSFLLAVLLNFFLIYQVKQLNIHKSKLINQLNSLSFSNEKLKKEKRKFKQLLAKQMNNKNVQLRDKKSLKNYSISQIKKEKLKISIERSALSPMIGKLIQIQYSKATILADLLKDKHNNILSAKGSVNVDKRGNSLWIQDSKEKLIQIERIIRQFDRPIKQIAIEARIVNVDKMKTSELGTKFGFRILSSPDVSSSNTTASLSDASSHLNMDLPFSEMRRGKIQLNLMQIAKNIFLDLELTALENAGELKIISTPHLITADQVSAFIQAGEDIPYQKKEGGDTVIQFQPAVLSLAVKPQVLPHHRLMLDLVVSQDQPSTFIVSGTPAIHKRGIKTQIIMNDGETVVLGGIYEHRQNQSIERIPLLGSLPILGRLFTYKETSEKCNELLIFLTPTILPL